MLTQLSQLSKKMNNSVLNVSVSCFENCQSANPEKVPLLAWLTSEKHRQKVENLRTIQNEDLQKVIKKSLPAITPCGLFSYRDTEHLIQHSGFLVFDIDKEDNQHISFDNLKEQISHIPNIAYCGLSVRGQGLWGLVPIPESTPEEHKQRFSALLKDFMVFNINLDPSGSDVCRLRIYSWDPEAYFNNSATLYTKILKLQAKKNFRPAYSDTRNKVEAIIEQIKASKIDITTSYQDWLKIGSSLANEFGDNGRNFFHAVSQYHEKYTVSDTDRMFDNVLKHDYSKISIASFFKIVSDYGIQENKRSFQERPIINYNVPVRNTATLTKIEKILKPGIWSDEIAELEKYFTLVKLPESIKIGECSTITDLPLFIKTHLSIVQGQNGKQRYIPYLERLQELKKILSN